MFYSAGTKGFYSQEINSNIPSDAVEITVEKWTELLQGQMNGKVISSDTSGFPILIDSLSLTHEQLVAQAEQQKSQLRKAADSEIAWLQDAVDAGIASDEETALLAEWKKYRVLLMRLDTSKAPDIEWPEPLVLA